MSAHCCDFHKYADDTELSQSAPTDEFYSVQTSIQTCIEDVLSWMNSNKLLLNTDKTEVRAVGTSSRISRVDCDSANIGGGNTPFQTSMKYLGVKLTSFSPCTTKYAVFVVPLFLNYDALHPSDLIFPKELLQD